MLDEAVMGQILLVVLSFQYLSRHGAIVKMWDKPTYPDNSSYGAKFKAVVDSKLQHVRKTSVWLPL